jgi:hypothetical protein
MNFLKFGSKKKLKKMQTNITEINKLYYNANTDEITEERLFEHLLLHPTGYIDKDDIIMNSPIANKYYRMGYITKGIDIHFKQQYRLTSFGLSQIELAMSLSLLS